MWRDVRRLRTRPYLAAEEAVAALGWAGLTATAAPFAADAVVRLRSDELAPPPCRSTPHAEVQHRHDLPRQLAHAHAQRARVDDKGGLGVGVSARGASTGVTPRRQGPGCSPGDVVLQRLKVVDPH